MHHRWPKTNGLSPTYLPPIVQAFGGGATACPDNSGLSICRNSEWVTGRHEEREMLEALDDTGKEGLRWSEAVGKGKI